MYGVDYICIVMKMTVPVFPSVTLFVYILMTVYREQV